MTAFETAEQLEAWTDESLVAKKAVLMDMLKVGSTERPAAVWKDRKTDSRSAAQRVELTAASMVEKAAASSVVWMDVRMVAQMEG